MTEHLTDVKEVPSKGWWSSSTGRWAQCLVGALFLGWITEASTAEALLMFMVLRLQLDHYYG